MKPHPLKDAYESYQRVYENSMEMRKMARQTFATALRMTRQNLNLTVRQLGQLIGVTGSLINQIERSAASVLKQEQINRIIELCEYSSKSTKENIELRFAGMKQAIQPPATNEESPSLPTTSFTPTQKEPSQHCS